jgi:hypothetical protein
MRKALLLLLLLIIAGIVTYKITLLRSYNACIKEGNGMCDCAKKYKIATLSNCQ